MELAVGMLALSIVVSALCGFAVYIAKSLEVQNSLRGKTPKTGGEVEVDVFLGSAIIKKLNITEKAVMPPRCILR